MNDNKWGVSTEWKFLHSLFSIKNTFWCGTRNTEASKWNLLITRIYVLTQTEKKQANSHHFIDIFRAEGHFRATICYLSRCFFDLLKEKKKMCTIRFLRQQKQITLFKNRLLKILPYQQVAWAAFDILERLLSLWIFLAAKQKLIVISQRTKRQTLPSRESDSAKLIKQLHN